MTGLLNVTEMVALIIGRTEVSSAFCTNSDSIVYGLRSLTASCMVSTRDGTGSRVTGSLGHRVSDFGRVGSGHGSVCQIGV